VLCLDAKSVVERSGNEALFLEHIAYAPDRHEIYPVRHQHRLGIRCNVGDERGCEWVILGRLPQPGIEFSQAERIPGFLRFLRGTLHRV